MERLMAETLLDVRDLRVDFATEKGTVRALFGVSFSVAPGETVGLVGESGCGKTTLGRAILQLYRPTAGSVRFDGIDLTSLDREAMRRMRRRVQMIFQDPYASLNPRMTVGRLVGEPLKVHGLARGSEVDERVRALLHVVGLSPQVVSRYPHEFSGGQRQRIGVARSLAVEPELVVADEPISALDVSIQAQIINLLKDLQSELGLTYIFIGHDLATVGYLSDRVAVMYLGRIVEVAARDELYDNPRHPYTQALFSAIPVPDPTTNERRKRIILTGDVPSPADPPTGCRFHPRCFLRERLGNPEICATQEPQLEEHLPGHRVACHFARES
jgi:oligopeptide transport system ATP-binding protein